MGLMTQLYARVFVQILDSSIAEDYRVRHVFEDFLKLCDHKTGIVDMTRAAMARRLNMPEDVLNYAIEKLEAPDPNSRDQEFQGRRLERLDKHRDWGWQILNWKKYDEIRTRADASMRVARHRQRITEETALKDMALKIYEAYPRRIGKPAAIKAILRAMRNYPTVDLLDKATKYCAACVGKDQQFIPHPSTWFNQERYNDDPATWNNSGGAQGSGKPPRDMTGAHKIGT